ncbi:MAG: glycosyl hydrolase family 28-related protein [Ignavibacteriales bacterium]
MGRKTRLLLITLLTIISFSFISFDNIFAASTSKKINYKDLDSLNIAKQALKDAGELEAVEGTDKNAIIMVKKIVSSVVPGVRAKIWATDNSQIASDGIITYGSNAVKGNVTFILTKNWANTVQTISVAVPAKRNFDTETVAKAKAALAEVTLNPVEGTNTNIISMAQDIIDKAVPGVTVTISTCTNSQIAFDGTIIYGDSTVTGNVTFILSKNKASATQTISVIVPAKVVIDKGINVKDFGAVGDGITDDTTAIQNAAYTARNQGETLYIPKGNYYVTSQLYFFTSVTCEGTFKMDNEVTKTGRESITFEPTVATTALISSQLSGLTRGSTNIVGLSGYKDGTLLLQSTEELIKRYDGEWGTSYTKNDACKIIDNNGGIYPALDCTYSNTSLLTVKVRPYEVPIIVDGLKIETSGDVNSYCSIIRCRRSNVTFNNCSVVNSGKDGPSIGMQIFDCANVIVNNPIISGIVGAGDKYGICLGKTCNISIVGGTISAQRHAVTGRHDKNVLVKGGYYTGTVVSAVDNHWGNNMVVENCTLVGPGGVSYSGTDVVVRSCNMLEDINIFSQRSDTPEIMGKIVIEDITAKTSGYYAMFVYRANLADMSQATYDAFGRKLGHPDSITIDNIICDVGEGHTLYEADLNPAIKNTYIPLFSSTGVSLKDGIGTLVLLQSLSDTEAVTAAKAALSGKILNPIEGTNTNVIPMAQAIVDDAVSGVTVGVKVTANSQVAADGTITYGNAAVTGMITFSLTKNSTSDTREVSVVVPAKSGAVKPVINVKYFGAVGDGKTDDAAAFQKAANSARDQNGILYIPKASYYINDYLNIYTSVNCEGTLLMRNQLGTKIIYISRTVNGIQLNPSSLSGLTRGSSTIGGLSGYENGTLVLKSKEVLIKRCQNGTWGDPYPKSDTSKIINNSGKISPALDSTYTDISKLTATAYPYEEPITISGLAIEMIGDAQNWGMMVKCKRSNVTFNNFKFSNQSTAQSPSYAVQVFDGHDITFNNPQITGIFGEGDKYGIAFEYGCNYTVDGGSIGTMEVEPGHAITGGNNKNVLIKNGNFYGYKGAVDSHWGNGFIVENCYLGSKDGIGVTYAGTDVTIKNCTVDGAQQILALRADTPELLGNVIVEDIKFINQTYWWGTFIFNAVYNWNLEPLDYGHTLQMPDSMIFKNIAITLPSSNYRVWYGRVCPYYRSWYSTKAVMENIYLTDGVGTIYRNFDYGG